MSGYHEVHWTKIKQGRAISLYLIAPNSCLGKLPSKSRALQDTLLEAERPSGNRQLPQVKANIQRFMPGLLNQLNPAQRDEIDKAANLLHSGQGDVCLHVHVHHSHLFTVR